MFALIFELIEWSIKLMIIMLVLVARAIVLLVKAMMIVTVALIALTAAFVEHRRQRRIATTSLAPATSVRLATHPTAGASPFPASTQQPAPSPVPTHPRLPFPPPSEARKDTADHTCPECGETVPATARICRRCGYRPL